MSRFLEQYKEDCRNYVHRTPYRLLRVVFAFIGALGLGGVCAFVANVTGEPRVTLVIGVLGGFFLLAVLILFERWLKRVVEGPPEVLTAEVVGDAHSVPWQGPPPAKRSSSGGCAMATIAALLAMTLLCCGGIASLVALGTRIAVNANRPQSAAAEAEDSILTFHEQQRRELEDMVRQQEEQLRRLERSFAPPRP
jgi:hypothetical protein